MDSSTTIGEDRSQAKASKESKRKGNDGVVNPFRWHLGNVACDNPGILCGRRCLCRRSRKGRRCLVLVGEQFRVEPANGIADRSIQSNSAFHGFFSFSGAYSSPLFRWK